MFTRSAIIILLVLLVAVSGFSQVRWRGPIDPSLLPGSAVALGEAGVALPDMDFVSINPAALALASDGSLVRIELCPGGVDGEAPYSDVSVSGLMIGSGPRHLFHVGKAAFQIGGAYSRSRYDFLPSEYGRPSTIQNADGSTEVDDSYMSLASHSVTVAVSVDWVGRFAVGGAVRRVQNDGYLGINPRSLEQASYPDDDRWGYDVGLMVELPSATFFDSEAGPADISFAIRPNLGVSWCNNGALGDATIEAIHDGELTTPRVRRWGAAVRLELQRTTGNRRMILVSFLPTYERESYPGDTTSYSKYGAEFGVGDAVFFRAGRINREPFWPVKTWGFSVSSLGILRVLGVSSVEQQPATGLGGIILNRLDVNFSFARCLDWWKFYEPGTNFYALTVSF